MTRYIINFTTAESEDFILLSNHVTFPRNATSGDKECFELLIIGDDFIEANESLRVTISSFTSDIVGDPSSFVIHLTNDDDSKNAR